jgi:hypothetical protein
MNRFQRPSPTRKGTGFEQPLKADEHWHIDISYINIYFRVLYWKLFSNNEILPHRQNRTFPSMLGERVCLV